MCLARIGLVWPVREGSAGSLGIGRIRVRLGNAAFVVVALLFPFKQSVFCLIYGDLRFTERILEKNLENFFDSQFKNV